MYIYFEYSHEKLVWTPQAYGVLSYEWNTTNGATVLRCTEQTAQIGFSWAVVDIEWVNLKLFIAATHSLLGEFICTPCWHWLDGFTIRRKTVATFVWQTKFKLNVEKEKVCALGNFVVLLTEIDFSRDELGEQVWKVSLMDVYDLSFANHHSLYFERLTYVPKFI